MLLSNLKHSLWRAASVLGCASALGCAQLGGSAPASDAYRCEHNIDFSVRFVDDSAVLDGPGGRDVLYRDAGGIAPGQTVYSNPRMRAEFGLGASGREALLR